jgi:hypothetical protein
MSNFARNPWCAVLWSSALLLLSGSSGAASVYNYETTGTFPSDTSPTAFWVPNGRFEYRFSLEPQTLNDIGPSSHILLSPLLGTEISYFLNGKHIADIDGPVGFSTGPTANGSFGTNLTVPGFASGPPSPVDFSGWFPGNPFDAESPRLYSYTETFPVPSVLTIVPTLYPGTFNVINESGPNGPEGFFGAIVGSPVNGLEISDAVVQVSIVPEGSSLVAMALGCIPAIGLWWFRKRQRLA